MKPPAPDDETARDKENTGVVEQDMPPHHCLPASQAEWRSATTNTKGRRGVVPVGGRRRPSGRSLLRRSGQALDGVGWTVHGVSALPEALCLSRGCLLDLDNLRRGPWRVPLPRPPFACRPVLAGGRAESYVVNQGRDWAAAGAGVAAECNAAPPWCARRSVVWTAELVRCTTVSLWCVPLSRCGSFGPVGSGRRSC